MASDSTLSAIIPVLNEQHRIGPMVRALRLGAGEPVQIVVVDGDPRGSTLAALAEVCTPQSPGADVVCITSGPGRGRQMNVGAVAASGEILVFVHADTALPDGWAGMVRSALETGLADAGAFDFQFTEDRRGLRFIAAAARLRSRLERVPYGDQTHFVRAETFRERGGYPEIPLMEDVRFMTGLKKDRQPICILPHRAETSGRRYLDRGMVRRVLGNLWNRLAHGVGMSPERLARAYERKDGKKA